MTPHPALPGLLLATAREPWPAWHAVTRLALADLCEELGRPAPWLRRGLHPKALARALVRGMWRAWGDDPPPRGNCPGCARSIGRNWDNSRHRCSAAHCLHLVRRHLAGGDTPPAVAACVGWERQRFRRRALCLFPGVRVPCPCVRCGGEGAWLSAGCVWCGDAGTATVPARDLLPRESGRCRRGHAALDRVITEAILPPLLEPGPRHPA
jgi:hypothetical protein